MSLGFCSKYLSTITVASVAHITHQAKPRWRYHLNNEIKWYIINCHSCILSEMAFFKLASFWSFDTDLQEKPLENPKSALENSLVKDGFSNGSIKDEDNFYHKPKPRRNTTSRWQQDDESGQWSQAFLWRTQSLFSDAMRVTSSKTQVDLFVGPITFWTKLICLNFSISQAKSTSTWQTRSIEFEVSTHNKRTSQRLVSTSCFRVGDFPPFKKMTWLRVPFWNFKNLYMSGHGNLNLQSNNYDHAMVCLKWFVFLGHCGRIVQCCCYCSDCKFEIASASACRTNTPCRWKVLNPCHASFHWQCFANHNLW